MSLPIWPRPSTRAFIREARRLPGYSFFDWLHGYVYARWVYLYIGIGTGEHPLAKRAQAGDRLARPAHQQPGRSAAGGYRHDARRRPTAGRISPIPTTARS